MEAVEIIDSASRILLPSVVVHEYVWVIVRGLGVPPGFVAEKLREHLGNPV